MERGQVGSLVIAYYVNAPPCGSILVSEPDKMTFIVSVGNILDSTDVRSTGALEPPDFVGSKCRELELAAPTAF